MAFMTSRARRLVWWSGFALLVLLSGCAAGPALEGSGWDGRDTLLDLPGTASAGQRVVEVDFEAPPPQRVEQLRQSGIQLPRVSQELADPRAHGDFVERRVSAVGFGLTAGGYLLYCEGLPLPVLVPESQVDLGLTSAEPLNASIYPDRDTALAASASGAGATRYAWYRGAGGALIVPTVFSPASTPRIARTMLEVRQHLAETVQRELKVLLVGLTGTRVLQGVFSRVVSVGSEPELRPQFRNEVPGGEAPASRQPATHFSARTVEPVPEPAAPASAQAAPAPSAPAPSPGLVQALTGNNPTPQAVAGPRLPQDVAVNPKVPNERVTTRPIGSSPSQNAQLQVDIQYLDSIGATNIRVNQQQITYRNIQRVGINRPDLQFDYRGRRYQVEYDSPTSGRGRGHQSRTTSNDPAAETILLIVP